MSDSDNNPQQQQQQSREEASPEQQQNVQEAQKLVKKILQEPPRYDRFSATARKHNPLVINEVRRAFQDNIRELARVECHCGIYHGAESVRIFLLLVASGVAFYLFHYGNVVRFPENVPVMKTLIIIWTVLTVIALFYVFAYLEARNFATLVLPSSESSEKEEQDRVHALEKFIALSKSDEESERNAIRAKLVDEDGNEIVLEKVDDDDDDDKKNAEKENDEEEEEEHNDDDEEEAEADDEELDSIMYPKKTEIKLEVNDAKLLEQTLVSSDLKNNKKAKDENTLNIPPNLGLQFYSEVVLGEPKVLIEANLVQFRSAFLSPKPIKTIKSTFYVEEFFSNDGLFYPPALRVEMRRIFSTLLLNSGSGKKKN